MNDRREGQQRYRSQSSCDYLDCVGKGYNMTREEVLEIIDANDNKGWDFLTIARKVGVKGGTA